MPYIIGLVVVVWAVTSIFKGLMNAPWQLWAIVGTVAVLLAAAMLISRKMAKQEREERGRELEIAAQKLIEEERRKNEERERLDQRLVSEFSKVVVGLVYAHAKVLYKKRSQCLYLDDYGKLCGAEQWGREVAYFRDNVVDVERGVLELRSEAARLGVPTIIETRLEWLMDIVERRLDEMDAGLSQADVGELTGPEYEVHCAERLEQSGWSVLRKGGSGDQGVDLVASLGQLRVAVQCKRYSQPVGNKAVQEVAAGRQYEQCDLGVVVSNAAYTPAARQLANALGVLLLHHSELNGFREQVEELFPALVSGEASA